MPSNRSNKPTPKAPPPHASDRARIVAGVLALAIYTAGVVLLMLGLGNGGLVFAACCLIGLGLQEGLCAAMARPPMWSKVRWPF